jgi:hypothetical protein
MRCCEFTDETAIVGSFWRWRKGSPPGHCVPETMLTFSPTTCALAEPDVRQSTASEAKVASERETRRSVMNPSRVYDLDKGILSL